MKKYSAALLSFAVLSGCTTGNSRIETASDSPTVQYRGNLKFVFCDIKRGLRRLTGQGPGEGFTRENYKPVLRALKDKMGCNGVRIEILTMVRKAADYPALYPVIVEEARALGFKTYSSPTEFARLLPPDLRSNEKLYAAWVADHANRFRPDYLGAFNEAAFNDGKMRRIIADVRRQLAPGYNPVFVGPDKAEIKYSLDAMRSDPSIARDFAYFGTHDINNKATVADWSQLVSLVRNQGREVWWTEASSTGDQIGPRIDTGIVGITIFWAFPRSVDPQGNLTERGEAIAAALRK